MSADVLPFTGLTKCDLPADAVLSAALGAGLSSVVVIGRDQSGALYFAASTASLRDVLWELEHAKRETLELGDA